MHNAKFTRRALLAGAAAVSAVGLPRRSLADTPKPRSMRSFASAAEPQPFIFV
jgi:hypothetical protein